MYYQVKGKKLIPGKERPQALGTVWVSEKGKYLHGPRLIQPKQLKKIYNFTLAQAKKRHLKLKNRPPNIKYVKAGTLKKTGKLAVQSYTSPIPKYIKVKRSKLIRSKKGKIYRKNKHLRSYGATVKKKKIKRASKFLKKQIAKELKIEGTPKEKKRIVKVLAKDPLLHKEFREERYPLIKIVPGLLKEAEATGQRHIPTGTIEIDPILFKDIYEPEEAIKKDKEFRPEKILESDMPLHPRETLTHEIQHAKYPKLKGKSIEEMAMWRSLFDIRKFKKPKFKEEEDIEDAFRGPLLKEEIKWKKSTNQ